MYHVGIDNSKLLTDRVASRFASGGHDVPEDKILERNKRNGVLIRNAVLIADAGLIFDNSKLNDFPKLCVSFNFGQIVHVEREIPRWIKQIYAEELRDCGFDV